MWGTYTHIRFVTAAVQKGSSHRIHRRPVMLSMTTHDAATVAMFGLHYGFSLLERMLFGHLWKKKTTLSKTPERTFLDCSRE